MLRDYEIDVLRVEADGSVSVVQLVLAGDSDTSFGGAEAGTVWRLDGVDVAGTPTLRLCTAQADTAFGPESLFSALHFEVGGVAYVVPRAVDVAVVTAITGIVTGSTIQTNFIGAIGTLLGTDVRQGQGLVVTTDGSGAVRSVQARTFQLLDDDRTIHLTAATEVGQAPVLLPGTTGAPVDLGEPPSGLPGMRLVEVECTLTGGASVTFLAMLNDINAIQYALVPLAGAVDAAEVATILSVTEVTNTLEGMTWAEFGLALNRETTRFDAGGNRAFGEFLSERLLGRGGDDTLSGAHGEDLIDGGGGSDAIYGGHNADVLRGGSGADTLHGGFDDDTLSGGTGTDRLDGSHGRDSLSGEGGDDTLTDGRDRDTLTGGGGADLFVLRDDDRRDVVTDFQDGIDLLDLGVGFGKLTITDVAPGEVLIRYRGDQLTLLDTAGLLTAADITRADLI